MVGDKTINYAASKMQPSAIAPRPMEIRPAGTETAEVVEITDGAMKAAKPTAKAKATPAKRKASTSAKSKAKPAKAAPKSKAKTAAKKTATKKTTATKKVALKSTPKPKSAKPTKMKKATSQAKTGAKKPNKAASASNEPILQNDDLLQAASESGKLNADMMKQMTEELNEYSSQWMSRNMQLSREFFKCRTMSDMFEVQNKIMKANLDSAFTQSAKLAEMMFKASGETTAPYNSLLTSMSDAWNKQMVK